MQFITSKTGIAITLLIGVFVFLYFFTGVFGDTRIGLTLRSNSDLENGLVAHYTFDSTDVSGFTVSDSSGNGNDGAIVATTTVGSEVLIDATGQSDGSMFEGPGAKVVWTSDSVGYLFYADNTQKIHVSSTTNAGSSWSLGIPISEGSYLTEKVTVWYDKWTPNVHSGRYIHIVTADVSSADELYYIQYDTFNDTFSDLISPADSGIASWANENVLGIVQANGGALYVTIPDSAENLTLRCETDCTATSSWNEISSGYGGTNTSDVPVLIPVVHTNNIAMVFDGDSSSLYLNVYSATSSSWWGLQTLKTPVYEVGGSETAQTGVSYNPKTGKIYVLYANDVDEYTTADHDISGFTINPVTFATTSMTDVLTNISGGVEEVKIVVDTNQEGYLYAIYHRRTTIGDVFTTNIYYKFSSDDGETWGAEVGPLNGTEDELDGIGTNIIADERISIFYSYDSAPNAYDVYSVNIADIGDYPDYKPTSGKIGQGMTFDGVDDYIDANDLGTTINSIAFWVNTDTSTQDVIQLSSSGAPAGDGEGDYMIRRNNSETDTITTSNLDATWDTLVDSSGSSISYSAGDFTLDSGKYLVMYSERFGNTGDTSNNERNEIQGRLVVDGTATTTGAGQAYLRKQDGSSGDWQDDGIVHGASILNIPSDSTTLATRFYRTDTATNPLGSTDRVSDWGGISIVKLDDSWNYARYVTDSNKAMTTSEVTYADFVWDTNVEEDTGFSRSGADITITNAGRYVVTYSIPVQGGTNRSEFNTKITLDGSEVPGSEVSTYLRTNEGTNDGVLTYVGIIEVASSDVLTIEHIQTEGAGTFDYLAGSSLEILQLPAGNEVIIAEATTGEMNPATLTEFAWDTTAYIDTDGFTMSAGTDSYFEVDVSDDYLLFATHKTDLSGFRTYATGRFSINDTILTHASGGEFGRGAGTAQQPGYSFGTLATGLTAGDDVSLENIFIEDTQESQTMNNGAMSALRLGSVFGAEGGGGTTILIDAGTASTSGITSPTFYVDGVETDVLPTADGWHHVVVTTNSAITADDVEVGHASGYFNGSLDDIRFYSRVLSANDVKRVYGLGATTKINKTLTTNPDLEDGLMFHYTFDGPHVNVASNTAEILDISGNEYNANWENHATSTRAGRIGQAIMLLDDSSESGDYVRMPDNEPVWLPSNDFTMSAWVQRGISAIGTDVIFDFNHADSSTVSNEVGYSLRLMSNDIVDFYVTTTSNTDEDLSSVSTVSRGEWVHLLAVRRGTSQEIYIDGELDNSRTMSSDPIDWVGGYDNDSVTLGWWSRSGATGLHFDGLIDEARLYNRALSTEEISRLYQFGATTKINKTLTTNPDLEDGLVGHWTFDGLDLIENARDISGSGNNGYLQNFSSTTTRPGAIGQAIEFDGVDDYVNLGDVHNITTDVTLSAWIMPKSWGNDGTIIRKGIGNASPYGIDINNGTEFRAFRDLTGANMTATFPIAGFALSEWINVVGVFEGDTLATIFVNGVERDSGSGSGTVESSAYDLLIGAENNGTVDFFDGRIDDVRIYNRALSDAEILRLYQLGGGN